jgi:hypothetical protein
MCEDCQDYFVQQPRHDYFLQQPSKLWQPSIKQSSGFAVGAYTMQSTQCSQHSPRRCEVLMRFAPCRGGHFAPLQSCKCSTSFLALAAALLVALVPSPGTLSVCVLMYVVPCAWVHRLRCGRFGSIYAPQSHPEDRLLLAGCKARQRSMLTSTSGCNRDDDM